MDVLIIDDDLQFAYQLKKDINSFFRYRNEVNNFIIKQENYNDLTFENVDVAFVDIDLITDSGINIAKKINLCFPSAKVIFISVREDLVFQTFSVNVFQFIRKRIYKQDSQVVFHQLKKYLDDNVSKIIIEDGDEIISLYPHKVKYIISKGRDVIICENKIYTIKSTMTSILQLLDYKDLVQIQRTMVVNLNFIRRLRKSQIQTIDNKEYSVGRVYQKQLIEKYEEYILR